MEKELFKKLYAKLNPEQKKAVSTIEGPVMVIAGPGTGKTQTLILRIAHILQSTQMNPENILALTFTESAVYEIRTRLLSIIGRSAYSVEINTFHGFCNKIIHKYPDEFEHLLAAEPATDLQTIEILQSILDNGKFTYIKPLYDPHYYLKALQSAIGQLKKESITPEKLDNVLHKEEKDFQTIPDLLHEKGAHKGKMKGKYADLQKSILKNKELVVVYKAYQAELASRKLYDYNDMLIEVITKLVKNPDLLQQLQEQYQYILVDEHQDTNAAQNMLIELITSYFDNPNLFVVGDEKQAIFRFQGASLENFLYFQKKFPEATLINLQLNYRSNQTILDAADSLISHNAGSTEELIPKTALTARALHEKTKISVLPFNEYFAEYFAIAQDIKEKIASGTPANEIAVIARNNRDIDPLIQFLEQNNVLYSIEADQNVLFDREIHKLLLLFKTIKDYGNDILLVKAMHLNFFGIHPLDIYNLVQFQKQENESLWNVISKERYKEKVELFSAERLQNFVNLFSKWKTNVENIQFDDVFVAVLQESGYLNNLLKQPHAPDHLQHLTTLYHEVRLQTYQDHTFTISQFLDYIDLLNQHNLSLQSKPASLNLERVRLMTAHKSKGLEFDFVYILNAYDTHWGNKKKFGSLFKLPWHALSTEITGEVDFDENEDERRLFYVSLTRARKEVFLSYSSHSLEGKEQYASQFIEEINPQFKNLRDTTAKEKMFKTHQEVLFKTQQAPNSVREIYLNNKTYFAELFKRQGLSVSGLNNYLECPWKYFFRNLLRLPEVKEVQQMYGTAIHEALSRYITAYSKKKASLELLLFKFKEAFQRQPFLEGDKEQFMQKGIDELTNYYSTCLVEWTGPRLSEISIKGIYFDTDIFLTGQIDMIEPTQGKNVTVYDFKTGKPKSRNIIEGKTGDKRGNYKRQLVFYKLLLDRYLNKKYNMTEGVIEFIQPTEQGLHKSEIFEITKEELIELENTIRTVADEIMNLSFWDTKCNDKDCEYCDLRDIITA